MGQSFKCACKCGYRTGPFFFGEMRNPEAPIGFPSYCKVCAEVISIDLNQKTWTCEICGSQDLKPIDSHEFRDPESPIRPATESTAADSERNQQSIEKYGYEKYFEGSNDGTYRLKEHFWTSLFYRAGHTLDNGTYWRPKCNNFNLRFFSDGLYFD